MAGQGIFQVFRVHADATREEDSMTNRLPFIQPFDQLPQTLPIFPLSSAVVMPGGLLNLNIFEPRYLNMVQDAIGTHRLIGMIQPRDDAQVPGLYEVGCAGRVTRYLETSDGRIELVLTGVCRFRVKEELPTTRGYRLVAPDWQPFARDYDDERVPAETAEGLNLALRRYLESKNLQADWEVIDGMEPIDIANSLVGSLPLSTEDKQLLLETSGVNTRILGLSALLRRETGFDALH